jgi:hypothetical protein
MQNFNTHIAQLASSKDWHIQVEKIPPPCGKANAKKKGKEDQSLHCFLLLIPLFKGDAR